VSHNPQQPTPLTPQAWEPRPGGSVPETHALGNGQFSSFITEAGGGTLRWRNHALTRWTPDSTRVAGGLWIYVRDLETGALWSAGRQPTGVAAETSQVTFHAHMAEFQRRDNGIALRMEVSVAPADDVEIRRLTLTNESNRPRSLALTSYAEVVLTAPEDDARHPAFSKLFVHSEYLPQPGASARGDAAGEKHGPAALLFTRRCRHPDERPPVLLHRLVSDDPTVHCTTYETDRERFLGRCGTLRKPAGLAHLADEGAAQNRLSQTTGFTLDTVMALETCLELAPNETRRLAFLTLAADSRESLFEIAGRYDNLGALDGAVSDAASQAALEVQHLGLPPERLPALQELLSHLLHANSSLRAPAATLAANRLAQPQLWKLGISGDVPILLLHSGGSKMELLAGGTEQLTGDTEPLAGDTGLVAELIRAQQLWRRRGIEIDLVVLCDTTSGNSDVLRDHTLQLLQDLKTQIEDLKAQEILGQRGGVHLLTADTIDDERRHLLQVAARVVLDTDAGTLPQQLARAGAAARELTESGELPRREPTDPLPLPKPTPRHELTRSHSPTPPQESTLSHEPTPPLERPSDLQFDCGLGGFTADGREYVIHLEPGANTPAPWCNVLANEEFGCLVTEVGGGFTWAVNSSENRLTPWANDPVLDPVGETLYLRDEESGHMWTPTPQPAGGETACQIRHGACYTEWRRNSYGIEQHLRVFVPIGDPVKVIHLTLRNHGRHRRRITATYYAEWVLGTLREKTAPFVIPEFDTARCALLARNPWNADFGERVAFLTCDRDPQSFTTNRAEFIGREGDASAPAALHRRSLSGAVRAGADPCAALQIALELGAAETIELVFTLGQGRNLEHAQQLIEHWRNMRQVEEALAELHTHWDRLLGAVTIRTPEPALDLLVNRWLLYQAISSRILGRTGYYQSSGAFGFRDQLQDVLALVHVDPARVRSHILECARHQFEEGDVLHWWHPGGEHGIRTRCSDDLLWLPFAVCHYAESTGDFAILDAVVPFLTAPPLRPEEGDRYDRFEPGERASLFEHCRRALERGLTSGSRGLPLMGAGDWNDGMNLVGIQGRGESVWLAWFCSAVANAFSKLCERRNERELAETLRHRAREIAEAIDEVAWDGEWYRRAYDDDGRAWGSAACDECRIDSIAQSWSVLSDSILGTSRSDRSGSILSAPGSDRSAVEAHRRARQALLSAERELVREADGVVLLLRPPFHATPREPGYIKAYPPGIRENGQYTHAAIWLAWAFAALGDGDRAARIFRLLNPIHHTGDLAQVQRYRVEPYVIAADVGSVPPHVGRGGWTWYTGSAAWAWRFAVEAILGLQRQDGKLRIAPCLPRAWRSFEATLRSDGGVLEIRVEDPEGVGCGAVEIELDGVRLASDVVELPSDGRPHSLRVRVDAPG